MTVLVVRMSAWRGPPAVLGRCSLEEGRGGARRIQAAWGRGAGEYGRHAVAATRRPSAPLTQAAAGSGRDPHNRAKDIAPFHPAEGFLHAIEPDRL